LQFDIRRLGRDELDAAAQQYEERGFFELSGLQDTVTAQFRMVLAEIMHVNDERLTEILDPTRPATTFPQEVRQRLAQAHTTPELSEALRDDLGPVLRRLIGPLTHVSSTFHVQYKGGDSHRVDHGGYAADSDFMEIYGQYLLHQDFTGATIPTSPSALTVWVAMNSCAQWNLRLYPGSHRLGMLCNQWLELDDTRLDALGSPIDFQAKEGTAVVFNAMLLHGTSNPGSQLRASCDIRFFPLCGFLPSQVHVLSQDAEGELARGLERAYGPVLSAPLLEAQVFLGDELRFADAPPRNSVLNWVDYIAQVMRGGRDQALVALERFVNTEIGADPLGPYAAKFHGRDVYEQNLRAVRERVGRAVPVASAASS
jgi:hypothetical protein